MIRKEKLVTGEIYHVFNKSIAKFTVFNNDVESVRMKNVLLYYLEKDRLQRYSEFKRIRNSDTVPVVERGKRCVQVIAYCLMQTHLHLVLRQLTENGILDFMRKTLNSYSRYFNLRHRRKGPLWEGRFNNVLVKTDEQLLHLTRYIHLNPVTAFLVERPEDWPMSSYKEYVSNSSNAKDICDYKDILTIDPLSYRQFVKDRISYQRELALIKDLLLEDSTIGSP